MSAAAYVWKKELRELVALALPVVLSELGWMLQGLVDTIMVGSLGAAAIGAVALGNAVYYVPAIAGLGLLLGLDTLVSQAYGRQDHDACHRWMAQGIYLACFLTPLVMLLIWGASYCFSLFGIAPELAVPAASFLRWINLGTLPLLIYGAARRYLQSVDQGRVVMWTFVAANLLNWLANWVLINGKLGFPALGIEGSALSTVLSRTLMAAALVGFAWRYERKRGHPLFRHWAAPKFEELKTLLLIGSPAAGQIVVEVGAWNLATLAAGWLSPAALASHQIVLNYASLAFMVPLGISAAAAVAVGHAVGAGDGPRARRAGWLALALSAGFMVLPAIVYALLPAPLIALYTRDAEVMLLAPKLMLIVAAFEIFDGIQCVATGALRGLGQTRWPMLAGFAGYWLMGLPAGLLLCFVFHRGVFGIWIGLTIALILIALILLELWRREAIKAARGSESLRTQ